MEHVLQVEKHALHFVAHARPLATHLLGLPEERDLFAHRARRLRRLGGRRTVGTSSAASRSAMRRCLSSTVRRCASVGCAVNTSSAPTPVRGALRRPRGAGRLLEAPRRARRAARAGMHQPARSRRSDGRGGTARRGSPPGSSGRTRAPPARPSAYRAHERPRAAPRWPLRDASSRAALWRWRECALRDRRTRALLARSAHRQGCAPAPRHRDGGARKGLSPWC